MVKKNTGTARVNGGHGSDGSERAAIFAVAGIDGDINMMKGLN